MSESDSGPTVEEVPSPAGEDMEATEVPTPLDRPDEDTPAEDEATPTETTEDTETNDA